MSDKDRDEERQDNPNSGAARNIAAVTGGLTVGGVAQRETLQGLISDDTAPGEDETAIADSSLDVFDDLDSTYRPEGQDADAGPALPDMDFQQPTEELSNDPDLAGIPSVEIATPSTGIDPLEDMALYEDPIEIDDQEDAFEIDAGEDDPDIIL